MQIKKSYLQFILIFIFIVTAITIANTCSAQPVDGLIKTGRDYLNLFQYDKAFESFKKAIDLDPNNWEANFNAGKALIKLKRLDEAEKYLISARKSNPTEVDVQKALGAIYMNFAKAAQTNGQTAKKLEYQLKACHAYPAATKVWLSLFEQWWDNNEFKKIKEEGDYLYKNNSALLEEGDDKNLQQALVMVAKAYYNDGEYNKSESFLNYASKIRQSNDELYGLKRQIKNQAEEKVKKILDQAESEIEKKDYKKAIETLKLAQKVAVSNQSEIENKIENLEKQIQINNYLTDITKLIDKKDYENAYTKIDEALQNFPDNEELQSKNEIVVKALEEIQEAKDKAEEAKRRREDAKRERENAINNFKREAKKYEKDKLYDEAIESLTKALKLTPQDKEIAKKIEDLKLDKKKAIERSNQYIKEFSNMQKYFDSKDYENAAETGESLLKKYPENQETISNLLTECYLNLEKYEEASKAVNCLENNEQYKDIYNYSKGVFEYNKGNTEKAVTYLELVKKGTSKYKSIAGKTLLIIKLTSWKAITGISIVLITLIVIILPKINEYMRQSRIAGINAKLEKIKESGNYEANYDFLKQRYEKEDADNMKLVMLLYSAALQKKGEYDQSYKLITDYLKRDSRSPLARNIAGETAMALGLSTPVALEQIQGLLKLNENRTDVIEYLAKTYMQLKADHKLGQEYISKYVSLNPSDTEALTYLADTYFSRQNFNQQSIKTFEKAIKVCPDKPEYYVALMENYKAVGNAEESNKMLNIIKEKFPDYYGSSNNSQQPDFNSTFDYTQDYSQPKGNDYNQQQPNYDFSQQTLAQQQIYANMQNYSNQNQYTSESSPDQASSQNYPVTPQNTNAQGYYPEYAQQSSADTMPMPRQNSSYYPDYDSIGADSLPSIDALADTGNGLSNFSDLIQPNKDIVSQEPQQQNSAPQVMGPKKNCPHCGAVNPAGEYYCNSCGRPF